MLKYIAILPLLLCQPAMAQMTGNSIYNACDAGEEMLAQQGFCIGFVAGAWQGMKYGAYSVARELADSTEEADALANRFLNVCVPEAVEIGQLVDVFVLYLAANPDTRHETARSLLNASFSEAFPCVKP